MNHLDISKTELVSVSLPKVANDWQSLAAKQRKDAWILRNPGKVHHSDVVPVISEVVRKPYKPRVHHFLEEKEDDDAPTYMELDAVSVPEVVSQTEIDLKKKLDPDVKNQKAQTRKAKRAAKNIEYSMDRAEAMFQVSQLKNFKTVKSNIPKIKLKRTIVKEVKVKVAPVPNYIRDWERKAEKRLTKHKHPPCFTKLKLVRQVGSMIGKCALVEDRDDVFIPQLTPSEPVYHVFPKKKDEHHEILVKKKGAKAVVKNNAAVLLSMYGKRMPNVARRELEKFSNTYEVNLSYVPVCGSNLTYLECLKARKAIYTPLGVVVSVEELERQYFLKEKSLTTRSRGLEILHTKGIKCFNDFLRKRVIGWRFEYIDMEKESKIKLDNGGKLLHNQGLMTLLLQPKVVDVKIVTNSLDSIVHTLLRITFLYQTIKDCKTWRGVFYACLTFWMGYENTPIHIVMQDTLKRLMTYFTTGDDTTTDLGTYSEVCPAPAGELLHEQGLEDVTNFLTENYQTLMKSEILSIFLKVLSGMSIFGVLSAIGLGGDTEQWKTRLDYLSDLVWNPRQKNVETFISRLLEGMASIVERIRVCIEKRDIGYLFGSKMSASEWIKSCAALTSCGEVVNDIVKISATKLFEEKLAKRAYGCITKMYTRDEALIKLRELDAMLPSIKMAYTDAISLAALVKQGALNGMTIKQWEMWRVNGSRRPEPIGILLTGGSAIGKTSFSEHIHRALGMSQGLSIDSSTAFAYNPDLNFQTFDKTQYVVNFDDIDTDTSPAAKNHVSTIISYLNNKPMNMEAPDIENKGQNWANFLMAIYCSNYNDCQLFGKTKAPLAFWRRFQYAVDLTPRPDFCYPSPDGGNRILNSTLIPPGCVDIWSRIVVKEFDPTLFDVGNPFTSVPYRIVYDFDASKYGVNILSRALNFLMLAANQHITRQMKLCIEAPLVGLCKQCGLCSEAHFNGRECSKDLKSYSEELLRSFEASEVLVAQGYERINLFIVMLNALWYSFLQPSYTAVWSWLVLFWNCMRNTVKRDLTRVALDAINESNFVKVGLPVVSVSILLLVVDFLRDKKKLHQLESQGAEVSGFLFPAKEANYQRKPVEITPMRVYENPGYNTHSYLEQIKTCGLTVMYGRLRMYGYQLGRGYILVPRHLFGPGQRMIRNATLDYSGVFEVEKRHERVVIKGSDLQKRMIDLPNRDMVLVFVPELFPNDYLHNKLVTSTATPNLSPDRAFLVRGNGDILSGTVKAVQEREGKTITNYVWNGDFKTVDGDCGSLLIGFCGPNAHVLGMHVGIYPETGVSVAEDIEGDTIRTLMAACPLGLPLMAPMLPDMVLQGLEVFEPLPVLSSLNVVLSKPNPPSMVVLGCLPIRAPRFRSHVDSMPCAEKWNEISEQICGKPENFCTPNPKGRMEGEFWKDPFTVNLDGASNVGGNINTWMLAVDDYVEQVTCLAGLERVYPMTEYEAINGIPGTVIGSVDMKTSAGPPFNCAKNKVMTVNENREFDLHPDFMAQIDLITDIVDRQDMMFSPVANHILKDEAISLSKQEELKIRVFNVLSAAFNLKLKQYFGPISAFMRRHAFYFESAIGMDVTCYQWSAMFEWLNVNPHWGSADNSFFDVKQSTIEWLMVVETIMRIARLTAYTVDECRILKNLLNSCGYVTRNIKGDYFRTTFMMPTGFWLTIFANGIRNSLQRRYAYFTLRPTNCIDSFRESVRQLVLGDDNIMTTNKTWFNQQAIQLVVKEFGAVLTSANKSLVIEKFERMEDVTFLKRSFRFQDGVIFAPIEMKTIIKMGQKRVASKYVTMREQAESIYANMISESFMHGRSTFNQISKIVYEICELKGYTVNAYDYDEYLKMHVENKLSVWCRNFLPEPTG